MKMFPRRSKTASPQSKRSVRLELRPLETRDVPATFTVTNLNDSGVGSFRQAILDANALPGRDTIRTDIAGTNRTINVLSPMPFITEGVAILGASATGASLHLNCAAAGVANGLLIDSTANDADVAGIAVTNAGFFGIVIRGTNNTLRFSQVGIDPVTGAAAGCAQAGIFIQNANAVILKCTSSGNFSHGLFAESSSVFVESSQFGTNTAGTAAVPNAFDGVGTSNSTNLTLRECTISGNLRNGVLRTGTSGRTDVFGSRIGVSSDGTKKIGNAVDGIAVTGTSGTVSIGTDNSEIPQNIISGNGRHGIFTEGAAIDLVSISNNLIGIGSNLFRIGNGGDGIHLSTGTNFANIGVGGVSHGNTIAGNGRFGILVKDALNTEIENNRIGVVGKAVKIPSLGPYDVNIGNGSHGIFVTGRSPQTIIGGESDTVNAFQFNAGDGILVGTDPAKGFTSFDNATTVFIGDSDFRGNFGQPIDLGANDGLTPNDLKDADDGPNGLLNFPTILSVVQATNSAGVLVTTIEFEYFPKPGTDPDDFIRFRVNSGPAGKATLINRTKVGFTNSQLSAINNRVTFITDTIPLNDVIAMTATDEDLRTSEFSLQNPPMIRDDALTPEIVEGGSAVLSGRLIDLDVNDTLTLRVNWGDDSQIEEFQPGFDPFAVQHAYLDDGVYNVTYQWVDAAGGSNSRTKQVTVRNADPTIRDFAVKGPASASADVRVSGFLEDAGILDGLTVTVNWGDGTIETYEPRGPRKQLNAHHQYRRRGTFRIQVTVTDDDGGSTSFEREVSIVRGR